MNKDTIEENRACETPIEELTVSRCWKPDCRKVATSRDKSGWEWCDDHLDQEKIGGLHALDIKLDYDYYLKRNRELLKEALQKSFHAGLQRVAEIIKQVYTDHNPDRPRASDLLHALTKEGESK